MKTRVSSPTKEVIIGDAQPTVLIGERINPAGKTKLQEALKVGNLDIVRSEALAQAQAGADILDVNVGTFGVNEVTLLPQAVQAVMNTVDIPLCLDSNNPAALEAALKIYKGKPLINSVTGEEHSLARVLPMAKEYGPAVIETIRKIKAELGVNMTLGASNVSFGLPDRDLLNNAFVVMAVAAGITCLIVDVAKVRPAIVSADLLLGHDKH